jgi:hypothetical protein
MRLSVVLLGLGMATLLGTACNLLTIGSSGSTPTQPPAPVDSVELRSRAVSLTLASATGLCADVKPFYWEIGNANARILSGSTVVGSSGALFDGNTSMPIASASKWLYAAYVAERRAGTLTAEDIQFLTFRSGYTNFSADGCDINDTVASCVARSTNGAVTRAFAGKFFYGGGHMQTHASLPAPGMDLGAMDNAALAAEIRRVLGTDIALTYTQPQLAGGVRTTPNDYALFLRKVMRNQLLLGTLLGTSATCTNPATCSTAVFTPTPPDVNWDYSVGHWIETAPVSIDVAFSSPGAFGFYPWISADRAWYGIVARVDPTAGAYLASARCGALIRKAWITAIPQFQ